MTKRQREQLAKRFPVTEEHLLELVRNYQGPVNRLPMVAKEETEATKLWELVKRGMV